MIKLKPTAYIYPKPVLVLGGGFLVLLILSCFSYIYEQSQHENYTPYKNWIEPVWYISIALAISSWLTLIISTLTSKLKPKTKPDTSKITRIVIDIIAAPILIPVCIIFFHAGISSAIGHTYTKIKGKEYTALITIDDTAKREPASGRYSSCPSRHYYPNVNEFKYNSTFGARLCFTREFIDSLPKSAILHVKGKESFFGRTILAYKPVDFIYDKQTFEQIKKDIKPQWVNLIAD